MVLGNFDLTLNKFVVGGSFTFNRNLRAREPDEILCSEDAPVVEEIDTDLHELKIKEFGNGKQKSPSSIFDGENQKCKRIKTEPSDSSYHAAPRELYEEPDNKMDIGDSGDRRRSIRVLDVPPQCFDVLELYLEDTKKGGGDVEVFEHDPLLRCSRITFAEESGKFTRDVFF